VTHQDCIESLIVEGYILGELSAVERSHFEEHYFDCAECAEAVRRLLQLRDVALAEPQKKMDSSRFRESANSWFGRLCSRWLRPEVAVAGAVVMLAITVITGYQNVQLKNRFRPQSVSSILLRPETRGEISAVEPQHTGQFIVLESDLPGAYGNLTWLVRAADGRIAMEGESSAPELGLSFKLLVPADQLHPGAYTLCVRSATGNEWTFRFKTGQH